MNRPTMKHRGNNVSAYCECHESKTQHIESLGKVCEHGSLARSCAICELQIERNKLAEDLKISEVGRIHLLQVLAKDRDEFRYKEIVLKAEVTRLNNDMARIDHELHMWKSRADRLAEALKKINRIQCPDLDDDMVMRTAQLGGALGVCFAIAEEALSEFECEK